MYSCQTHQCIQTTEDFPLPCQGDFPSHQRWREGQTQGEAPPPECFTQSVQMELPAQWTGQYEQHWKDLLPTRKTTGDTKILHVLEVRSSNHRQEKETIKKERQRSVTYRSIHVICFLRHWNEPLVILSSPERAGCRMQVIKHFLPCQQLAAMDINPEIQPQKALNWFDIAKYILYTLPLLDCTCSPLLPPSFV